MYIRDINSRRQLVPAEQNGHPHSSPKRQFSGLIILLLFFLGIFFFGHSHASSIGSPITSGYKSYCLDNHRNLNSSGNSVEIWSCNGQAAQDWSVSLTQIKKPGNLCLSALSVNKVDVSNCDQSAKQVWLQDNDRLYNPHFGLCLTAVSQAKGQLLDLLSCNQTNKASQVFILSGDPETKACSGSSGSRIACSTIKEWMQWQANPNQRMVYLTSYTDGTPYEQWCADFVSYIYKEAGYPFTNGETNGWDENLAQNIQNQGFTIHQPGSYTPKPGDVAYFDYDGGHVELVVTGGKNPTFIYGDSATVDPLINNGSMEANDITSDSNGSLQYYMSPNSNT